MFKKLLLSLSIVTAVGAAGILGTQALLTDQAVLSANTFSTGTADLQIARDDTAFLDQVTGFTGQIAPGVRYQGCNPLPPGSASILPCAMSGRH